MLPVAPDIISAVKALHEFGIAHRDISLENILLTDASSTGDRQPQLKIIVFGMATVSRMCRKEICGKHQCQAPVVHLSTAYDAFKTDVFAIAVSLFALAAQVYPWNFTKKEKCKQFNPRCNRAGHSTPCLGLSVRTPPRDFPLQRFPPFLSCLPVQTRPPGSSVATVFRYPQFPRPRDPPFVLFLAYFIIVIL